MAKADTVLVAVVADTHINSRVGLPPGRAFNLEEGGTFRPSRPQRSLWSAWQTYWETVYQRQEELGARLAVIALGDLLDINKHDGLDPITKNRADVLRMGIEVFAPVAERANWLFILRGTEAHTGEHCELEEVLARDLGAVADEERGTASWGWLWAELGGVTFACWHHPQTNAFRPWTFGASTARLQDIINVQFLRQGVEPPDVALFAHVHRYDVSGTRIKPQVFRCPAWKLLDGLDHRRGQERVVEEVGGLLITCRGGEYEWQSLLWTVRRRRKPWTAS